MNDVYIAGVGMTRFAKSDRPLRALAAEATRLAVEDAGLGVEDLQAAYVGNGAAGLVTGQEMIRGQLMLRELGVDSIPIVNVENACASASTALHLGWQAIASGMYDVVLCLGAEKLTHPDKTIAMRAISAAADVEILARSIPEGETVNRTYFMDIYAQLTKEYMERSGATAEDFAKVVVKNQANGSHNPRAQYGGNYTVEEVLDSRMIADPLRLLMCSPISDGAAATVLVSERVLHRIRRPGPVIRASVLVSGSDHDHADLKAGSTGRAVQRAYDVSGLGPTDIDVVELHDASAPAELMLYEQLQFAEPGGGPALLASGATSMTGKMPVNTSGGLLSKGHPIGASGLAQICELTWQLCGEAGPRQVDTPRIALAQNGGGWIGNDSAAMSVHILTRN